MVVAVPNIRSVVVPHHVVLHMRQMAARSTVVDLHPLVRGSLIDVVHALLSVASAVVGAQRREGGACSRADSSRQFCCSPSGLQEEDGAARVVLRQRNNGWREVVAQ